jgi:hypothetical protein
VPYIQRSVPQALDIIDPGVIDVYSSPTVFVNYQQVALWNAPQLGNSVLSQLNIPPPPPYQNYAPNPEQLNNYNASAANSLANPNEIDNVAGGSIGVTKMDQGNAPGPNTSDPNDLAGNADTAAGVPLASGDSVFGRVENLLNQCLQDAAGGAWKANGNNQNILACYAQNGGVAAAQRVAPGDACPWCAAFAGWLLRGAGAQALVTFSADSYRQSWVSKCGAKALPITDPSTWRRNDLVVHLDDRGNHHVTFIRGVDLQQQVYQGAGGNQSHNMTQCTFQSGSSRWIAFVGRAWEVPSEFDKPIIQSLPRGYKVPTR